MRGIQGVRSKVRKGLWLAASLLVVIALLAGGCVGHPRGMKDVRWLTEDEKNRVIEIALGTPEASGRLKEYGSQYTASLGWVAIVWGNSEYSEWRSFDYDIVETGVPRGTVEINPEGSSEKIRVEGVSGSAEFYAWVVINFGEPPEWQVYVAVNPDTGKVALVEENPFRTGPTLPEEVK